MKNVLAGGWWFTLVMVWTGAASTGAPWAGTSWAEGEGGSTVKGSLSTTKAAVGSDEDRVKMRRKARWQSFGWEELNSLLCCGTADSSPPLKRTAGAGAGCCWGTETLGAELWLEDIGWDGDGWAWDGGWETVGPLCCWFWGIRDWDAGCRWETRNWSCGSAPDWGAELSGPSWAIGGWAAGEKTSAAGFPESWSCVGEQMSGRSSGSDGRGETSLWSWADAGRLRGVAFLLLMMGEASGSIGTTGNAPTSESGWMGEPKTTEEFNLSG